MTWALCLGAEPSRLGCGQCGVEEMAFLAWSRATALSSLLAQGAEPSSLVPRVLPKAFRPDAA